MARVRQERAVSTRETILRAAAQVFDECGYSGAGINSILERAGTTAGALYFHFKSKEGLARAVVLEQAADLAFPEGEAGLQQLLDSTMYLAAELQSNVLLRAGVKLAVEQGESGLREFAVYEYWVDQFAAELRTAREMGQLLPEVDEGQFARVLVASFTGTQVMSKISTGHADLPEQIALMWRYLLRAIATPQALGELVIVREGADGAAGAGGAKAADEADEAAESA
ncbi:ScbR family autoregulator-binding transcription factor [Streptomyces sp. NRRL F-2747]|uniref:ScbR family autoregulator-binding transcription factor n=1 Tax=Streptomyces sp. NRRL F-2747 TaxID=1463843 RepID=UPI0007C50AB6|nr:ScbR family autoregulator-binding transcription factor [Streptomyces sp. NRRL F-2747]